MLRLIITLTAVFSLLSDECHKSSLPDFVYPLRNSRRVENGKELASKIIRCNVESLSKPSFPTEIQVASKFMRRQFPR